MWWTIGPARSAWTSFFHFSAWHTSASHSPEPSVNTWICGQTRGFSNSCESAIQSLLSMSNNCQLTSARIIPRFKIENTFPIFPILLDGSVPQYLRILEQWDLTCQTEGRSLTPHFDANQWVALSSALENTEQGNDVMMSSSASFVRVRKIATWNRTVIHTSWLGQGHQASSDPSSPPSNCSSMIESPGSVSPKPFPSNPSRSNISDSSPSIITSETVQNIIKYNIQHSDFPLTLECVEQYVTKQFLISIIWAFSGDAKLDLKAWVNVVIWFPKIYFKSHGHWKVFCLCIQWKFWWWLCVYTTSQLKPRYNYQWPT